MAMAMGMYYVVCTSIVGRYLIVSTFDGHTLFRRGAFEKEKNYQSRSGRMP